jgi:hypothetical protein
MHVNVVVMGARKAEEQHAEKDILGCGIWYDSSSM